MNRASSPAVDRPRRRSGLLERALPEELVLYDPRGDRAWLLNRTAAAVWDLADGGRHRDEIAAELARGFGITPAQAAADVARVIGELGGDGLLLPAPVESPASESSAAATVREPAPPIAIGGGDDGPAGGAATEERGSPSTDGRPGPRSEAR